MEDANYWDNYWSDNKAKKTWLNSLISFLRKAYFAKAFAKNIARFADIKGKSVCELGSGSALTLKYLKELGAKKCTGIDYSREAIEYGKENYQECDFIHADLMAIEDSLTKKFDIVYSLGLIEHYSKEEQLKLVDIHRKLARESIFIEVPHDMIILRAMFALNKKMGRTMTFSDEELFSENSFRNMGLQGKVMPLADTFYLTIAYFEKF